MVSFRHPHIKVEHREGAHQHTEGICEVNGEFLCERIEDIGTGYPAHNIETKADKYDSHILHAGEDADQAAERNHKEDHDHNGHHVPIPFLNDQWIVGIQEETDQITPVENNHYSEADGKNRTDFDSALQSFCNSLAPAGSQILSGKNSESFSYGNHRHGYDSLDFSGNCHACNHLCAALVDQCSDGDYTYSQNSLLQHGGNGHLQDFPHLFPESVS